MKLAGGSFSAAVTVVAMADENVCLCVFENEGGIFVVN